MKVTFKVNKELLADVLQLTNKYAEEKNVQTGEKLVTLMAAAHELIRAGNLQPEARRWVQEACIERLVSDERNAVLGLRQ